MVGTDGLLCGRIVILVRMLQSIDVENQALLGFIDGASEMNLEVIADGASRFAAYVEELTKMIGPQDQAGPRRDCCAGLLVSEGRRSVEPMAGVTATSGGFGAASEAAAFRCQCAVVGRAVLAKVRKMAVPAVERHGFSKIRLFQSRAPT
jgi:hypothetical protein